MTPTEPNDDRPFFHAVLTPHRSLSVQGYRIVMGGLALVFGASGLLFWLMGAWPIAGFFGLDVLLLWLAFRANFQAARAFEEVTVSVRHVVARHVSARGRLEREAHFQAFWTRLLIERDPDEGITDMRLSAHGRTFPVGGVLAPPERESFAAALSGALADVRSGRHGG